MFLFKRKRQAGEGNDSALSNRMAKSIAGLLLSLQTRFSDMMSAVVNNLSVRRKKVGLALFCIVFGGLSVYVLFNALSHSTNSNANIKPASVEVPKYHDQSPAHGTIPRVSEKDILRIKQFKRYMDSLRRSEVGRQQYDSILSVRPGLMDSINLIEEIYYSQSK